MTSNHKVSYSNHKLFQDALRWTQRYVTLSRVFGLLLLIGAGHVLVSRDQDGPHVDVGGGGPDEASLVAQTIQRRSAAIGMVTTGVMGLLVSVMVSRQRPFVTFYPLTATETKRTQKFVVKNLETNVS